MKATLVWLVLYFGQGQPITMQDPYFSIEDCAQAAKLAIGSEGSYGLVDVTKTPSGVFYLCVPGGGPHP